MVCTSCGEHHKHNKNKDFTKAVIEINNPEAITLLRKVVIPASMGTEQEVPAAIGKYRNVVLVYEANKHVYLYSSDGIPTLLEMDVEVPQEVLDRIDSLEATTEGLEEDLGSLGGDLDSLEQDLGSLGDDLDSLEQQFEDFKNSPDVVDIVPTYAALQDYDTSALSDKDVIRVLADETHEDESAYYRWNLADQTWTFIGATGPYYTKSEIDATVEDIDTNLSTLTASVGRAKVLSSEDYNWNSTTHDTTEPYDSVALWLLEPGLYTAPTGVIGYIGYSSSLSDWRRASDKALFQITPMSNFGMMVIAWEASMVMYSSPLGYASVYSISRSSGRISHGGLICAPIDDITRAEISARTDTPLSAACGYRLNQKMGELSNLVTTDKSSLVSAINEVASGGGGSTFNPNYSTTEELTGGTWIDGNPIYKKTFQFSVTGTNTTVNHGISNLLDFVSAEGMWKTGGVYQPINRNAADQTDQQFNTGLGDMDATKFLFQIGSSMQAGGTATVTLYYTKSV